MRQTIHIFLKDARRSWPYLAVVLVITAALAVLTPVWSQTYAFGSPWNSSVDFLQMLLPVAWWFTIVHLVHGEELTGDRQFWLTRPYSRKSLLAAKALFCAAFLVLPFLISDCIILSAAGFSPAALIPGLLRRQYSLAANLMLPPFLLATLTRNLRQFALWFLAVVIAFVVLPVSGLLTHPALSAVLTRGHPDTKTWFEAWGSAVLWGGGSLAFLFWRYARRQTAAARAIVIALLAWTAISSAWTPSAKALATAMQSSVRPVEYPEIAVVFAPERGRMRQPYSGSPDTVGVWIPIQELGRDPDLVWYESVTVGITPERGEPRIFTSGPFHDTGSGDWIWVNVGRQDFQRLNRGPVQLHAVFGVVVYQAESVTKLRPFGKWAKIPGFGDVAIREDSWLPMHPMPPMIWWRAPLQPPADRIVYTIRSADSKVRSHGEWSGTYPAESDELHISPIEYNSASVQVHGTNRPIESLLTRDDEVEFTVERPLTLVRRDLLIPSIRLGDYVPGPPTAPGSEPRP